MVVRKRGNKWCVMHSHGAKAGTVIKCFPTNSQAERMHRAIEANKSISYEFVSDSIQLEEVEVKGVKQYFVSGYITTGIKDLVNDIVTDECQEDMLRQLKSGNIKIDVEHELWKKNSEVKTPAGRIVDSRRDGKGLWVKAALNTNYPNFKTMLEQIQQKFYDAFSIAFRPVKFAMKEMGGVKTRLLKKIQLLNVAITGNPANPECLLGAVATKSVEDYENFLKENKMEAGDMDVYPDVKHPVLGDAWEAKAKDERPPKGWWDRCTRKVKGLATDSDKLCGWIWQRKQGKKELDSSEFISDAELKILMSKEEPKMQDEPEEKPEGEEAPPEGEPKPEEAPETGNEAETKNLEAKVEALQKEVKELKEKGVEEKIAEIKTELLEMQEFKDVKEAEEAVMREEKIDALQKEVAELQGIIHMPAMKGVQSAPLSETEAAEELERKANAGTDKSGPLDHI